MVEISIVILNYNGKGYLETFIPSLIKYSQPFEIVVADNASTDDSVDFLKTTYPEVRIIELTENYGYAGGYNEALKQIDAEYFILLNSDIEVTENWVTPLLDTLKSNRGVVACQPKIRSFHQKEMFEYAGAAGGYIDWLGYPFCRGRLFDEIEKDEGQYDDDTDIFWATGACIAVKKSVFHQLGGFDNGFFAHMEEIDLCWRIQNSGYRIKYCHESIVYHVGGGTLSSNNPRKTYLNFRNGLYLLVKNIPLWQLLFKIPLRSILDLIAAAKFISEGNGKHAISICKAHIDAAIPSIKYILRRKHLNHYNQKYISDKLIIVDYFLRKRRKYSKIKFKWSD